MGAVFIQRIRRKKIKPSHVNITHPFSAREAPLHLTSSPKKEKSIVLQWMGLFWEMQGSLRLNSG